MCQRIKNRIKMPARKLKLSKVPKKPQTHLIVNFITKLLLVAGMDMVLVVCDRLSKITHFVATIKGLAGLFRDNMWKLHRLLKSIILDRELQFVAEMTRELNSMLGIKMKLSIAFYPQTDGQMERINQKLEQYLRFFVDHRQKD